MEEGTNKNFTSCPTYEELRDTIKVPIHFSTHL